MPPGKAPPAGHIITFYSYKGGTGRSMLLANVAWILASAGKRVLVVDWDLEAPGVHRYFQPFLVDPDLTSTDGVIDMVLEFAAASVSPGSESEGEWYRRYADILRYAVSLDHDFGDGMLDLLIAGRQGASYSTRVNTFDWRGFYELRGGGAFLEAVKRRMRGSYDYILVDSRTGVSDTSGICTVQMPDTLVVCFTMNNQSIEGAAGVAASVLDQRRGTGLRIFPVPTRVEDAEKEKLEQRRELMRERFALFPNQPDGSAKTHRRIDPEAYWGGVEMPYVPYYAYEEILTTIGDRSGQPTSLLAAAERLTSWLTEESVKRMPPLPERRRLELLASYAPRPKDLAEDELAHEAELAFGRLGAAEQAAARRLFTRLVRVARPGEGRDQAIHVPVEQVTGEVQLAHSFVPAGILHIGPDATTGEQVVAFGNPALLERWPRLRQWIDDDRAFLAFRDLLRSSRHEWERSKRDAGTLLAGSTLKTAETWEQTRGHELAADDREFIAVSRAARRRRQIANAARAAVGGAAMIALVVTVIVTERRDALRQQAAALASAAATFEAAGQLDSAFAAYTSAIERDRELVAAWHGRGHILLDRGQPDSALENLHVAVTLDPTNAEAWADKGSAYAQLGDAPAAVDAYTRAIDLKGTTPDVFFSRGAAYQALGDTTRAIADFQSVLAANADTDTRVAATARLTQLGVRDTTAQQTRPPDRRVRMLIASGSDERIIDGLTKQLADAGFTVRHEPRSDSAAESTDLTMRGIARASSDADLPLADRVADIAEKFLAGYGYRVRIQRASGRGTAQDRAPVPRTGEIELWLPRLAVPSTAK